MARVDFWFFSPLISSVNNNISLTRLWSLLVINMHESVGVRMCSVVHFESPHQWVSLKPCVMWHSEKCCAKFIRSCPRSCVLMLHSRFRSHSVNFHWSLSPLPAPLYLSLCSQWQRESSVPFLTDRVWAQLSEPCLQILRWHLSLVKINKAVSAAQRRSLCCWRFKWRSTKRNITYHRGLYQLHNISGFVKKYLKGCVSDIYLIEYNGYISLSSDSKLILSVWSVTYQVPPSSSTPPYPIRRKNSTKGPPTLQVDWQVAGFQCWRTLVEQ